MCIRDRLAAKLGGAVTGKVLGEGVAALVMGSGVAAFVHGTVELRSIEQDKWQEADVAWDVSTSVG